MANVPTISWDEGSPIGSQAKALGSARIIEWKTQIREILGVDHIFDSTGQDTDWGYHSKLSFYPYADDITTPSANTGCLYVKTVSGLPVLCWIDEDDNIMQLTSGNGFIGGLVGEVRMWWGTLANIPIGWELCDGGGAPARPNLIAKFVRGIATDATEPGGGAGVGADSITISATQMKAHTHTASTASGGSHAHYIQIGGVDAYMTHVHTTENKKMKTGGGNPLINHQSQTTSAQSVSHTHTGTSNASGGGVAYDNRPAYYEVAYIIKMAY